MTDAQKYHLYRCLLIAAVLLVAYCNIFQHGFVWDDSTVIVENQNIASLKNLPSLFLSEDKVSLSKGYYRPITYVSFLADRLLWGLNPVGFNLSNLLLHIGVALAFYLLIRELFRDELYALFASLLFSLNPIANETVNFHAGGRNTLLCALFALLAALFHLKRKPLVSLLFFTLGIFSKEFALLMPALLLVYDRFLSGRKPAYRQYLYYLAAAAGYLVLRGQVVESANFLGQLELKNLFLFTPRLLAGYLANMLLPFRLQTMYDIQPGSPAVIVPSLLLLLALAAAAVYYRKREEILLAATWFFLFMLPVCGVLPLGLTMMADRYAYFSSMGFALALAYLVRRANAKAALAVVAVLCLWYGATDLWRNRYWQDEISFFTQMVKDVPERAVGYQNLGFAYYEKGDFDQAEKNLSFGTFSTPDHSIKLIWLGEIMWEMQKYEQALAICRMRASQEPDNPHPYMVMSRIRAEQGDAAGEKSYREQALRLFPGTEQVLAERARDEWRLGNQLLAQGEFLFARQRFQNALGIEPNFVPALLSMAEFYQRRGEVPRAGRFLAKAVAVEPGNAQARRELAEISRQ